MRCVYGAVGDGGLGVLYNYLHQPIRANHHKDGAKTAAKTGGEMVVFEHTGNMGAFSVKSLCGVQT